MSRNTTSGRSRAIARDRLGAFGAFADDLHVGMLRQQTAEPGARERLVVHDQRADRAGGHAWAGAMRSGMERVHTAPPSGLGVRAKRCSRP